jgi:hypothetical protein
MAQAKQQWKRISVVVPKDFDSIARSQRRSMSNFGSFLIENALSRRPSAPEPDKQHIKQANPAPCDQRIKAHERTG